MSHASTVRWRAVAPVAASGEIARQRTAGTRDQLTPQEAQIARLARDGLSNPEIAAQLFLSVRTVEWHLRKVFTKLEISSRLQLQRALPDGGQRALAPPRPLLPVTSRPAAFARSRRHFSCRKQFTSVRTQSLRDHDQCGSTRRGAWCFSKKHHFRAAHYAIDPLLATASVPEGAAT